MSHKFEYNGEGNMSYEVKTFDGMREHRDLEIPQLGLCIAEGEKPAVTKKSAWLMQG